MGHVAARDDQGRLRIRGDQGAEGGADGEQAIQGEMAEAEGNDPQLRIAKLQERHLHLQRMLEAVGRRVGGGLRGGRQQGRGEGVIDGDAAQRSQPVPIGINRSRMAEAMMIGADDHHPRRHLDAGEGGAGDRPGIDVAGMRDHHAGGGSRGYVAFQPGLDHPAQLLRIVRVELAGNSGHSGHSDLPLLSSKGT